MGSGFDRYLHLCCLGAWGWRGSARIFGKKAQRPPLMHTTVRSGSPRNQRQFNFPNFNLIMTREHGQHSIRTTFLHVPEVYFRLFLCDKNKIPKMQESSHIIECRSSCCCLLFAVKVNRCWGRKTALVGAVEGLLWFIFILRASASNLPRDFQQLSTKSSFQREEEKEPTTYTPTVYLPLVSLFCF